MTAPNNRINTGVSTLDKHLGGGIPHGAIVTCNSDPRTQSELFIHTIISDYETLYISTIGNEETVKSEFAKSHVDAGDNLTVQYANPGSLIQDAKSAISTNQGKRLIVINSINVFEKGDEVQRGEYQKFLNTLQNLLRRTGGVAFIHRYEMQTQGEFEYITNSISDIIFELDQSIDGDKITNHLNMPKCRGGVSLDERLKLKIDKKITVDTSRDIA